jgi:outer membrane lipoprotein carrier protein
MSMHFLLAIALLCPAAPKPMPQSVDATITRAQAAWAKVRTLRATFHQSITNPITGSAMESKGTLQQRKPNKLAIIFSDPAGDRIVADGKFVWVFLQSATPGQVIKLANTDVGAASTDLIGQFLSTPRSKYDAVDAGMDRVNGRATRALVLTAKSGQRLPFIRAKVWVDSADALIRRFESTDANGITRSVTITAMTPNAAVQRDAFTFKVPDGVRVVDR